VLVGDSDIFFRLYSRSTRVDYSIISETGFYRLQQLRRCRRLVDAKSVATFVHAFVSSRVDYCNAVMALRRK